MVRKVWFFVFLVVISSLPFVNAQEIGCPMNDQLLSLEEFLKHVVIRNRTDFDIFDISGGEERIQWSPSGFMTSAGTPDKSALCFVKHYKTTFRLVDPDNELKLSNRWGNGIEKDRFNSTHVSFSRIYKNIEVDGNELLFHFDRNGSIYFFNGNYRPSFQGSTNPTITTQQAIAIAQQDYGSLASSVTIDLIFFTYNNTDRLAWLVHYSTYQTPGMVYVIDAKDGKILYKDTGIRYAMPGQGTMSNNNTDTYLLLGSGIIILIIVATIYAKRK